MYLYSVLRKIAHKSSTALAFPSSLHSRNFSVQSDDISMMMTRQQITAPENLDRRHNTMHACVTFNPVRVPSAFRDNARARGVTPKAQRGFTVRAADEEVDPEEVLMDCEERMDKSIESIRTNFNTVRTGRANAAILDRVEVEYYGAMTPLQTIANATTPDAQTILIQPFDKGAINDIERALMMSDLGLTPGNDGNCIRLNIPPLTADRRKELAKLVSKLGEDGKVAIRNVRRDALKSIGKLEGMGEDQIKDFEEQVDKLSGEYVKQVDALVKAKEEELSKV